MTFLSVVAALPWSGSRCLRCQLSPLSRITAAGQVSSWNTKPPALRRRSREQALPWASHGWARANEAPSVPRASGLCVGGGCSEGGGMSLGWGWGREGDVGGDAHQDGGWQCWLHQLALLWSLRQETVSGEVRGAPAMLAQLG